jgi:hypothetical protein
MGSFLLRVYLIFINQQRAFLRNPQQGSVAAGQAAVSQRVPWKDGWLTPGAHDGASRENACSACR